MDNLESQNQQNNTMDFKKPIHLKIKEFFLEDKSEEGRKLLAQEKRKISKHMKEMQEEERAINMRKDFTISGISNYAFKIMNLPVDDPAQLQQLYFSSLLRKQTFANGKKCATPKVKFLSSCTQEQANSRKYIFDEEVILQIEIEAGARLILKVDGKFPQVGSAGCEVIYQTNYQKSFTHRCTLRMKAQKDGMIESNCVSFQLKPNFRPGQQTKARGYTVKKPVFTFDQSNSIEQSQIFFPN